MNLEVKYDNKFPQLDSKESAYKKNRRHDAAFLTLWLTAETPTCERLTYEIISRGVVLWGNDIIASDTSDIFYGVLRTQYIDTGWYRLSKAQQATLHQQLLLMHTLRSYHHLPFTYCTLYIVGFLPAAVRKSSFNGLS